MKKLIALITIILLGMVSISKVDAHFLATDKNIGAILHVDPNDDPIAGEQASFFFEFKDLQNKFKPAYCDCTFSINEDGKEIYAQPLFQNSSNPSLTNASVFYTFPQKDVYEVKVVGKPITPQSFQSFILTWNFRVDQTDTTATGGTSHNHTFFATHSIHIIGGSLLVIIFIIYLMKKQYMKKNTTTKGGDKQNDKEINNIQY